jgi:hypothetical protein
MNKRCLVRTRVLDILAIKKSIGKLTLCFFHRRVRNVSATRLIGSRIPILHVSLDTLNELFFSIPLVKWMRED